MEDFYQRYSQEIGNINVKNNESPYIKIVIERTIQKNKILQDTKNLVDKFNEAKNQYNNIEDKEITNMYKILDTSLDNYSIDEMKKFKDYLGKLEDQIDKVQNQTNTQKPSVWNILFNKDKLNSDKKSEYKKSGNESKKESEI